MIKSDLVNALAEMDYCKNQVGEVISDIFRVIAERKGHDSWLWNF